MGRLRSTLVPVPGPRTRGTPGVGEPRLAAGDEPEVRAAEKGAEVQRLCGALCYPGHDLQLIIDNYAAHKHRSP
jgi:hypothetical protein